MNVKSLEKLSIECLFKEIPKEKKYYLLGESLTEEEQVEYASNVLTKVKREIYKGWLPIISKSKIKYLLKDQGIIYAWHCFKFQQNHNLTFDIQNFTKKFRFCVYSVLDVDEDEDKTEKWWVSMPVKLKDGYLEIETNKSYQKLCKYDTNLLKKRAD